MKRGKRVLAGILILGIIVSLGFIIGADEGELDVTSSSHASLTVSGSSSPPEIVYISDIDGALLAADVPSASRNLVSDGVAVKTFEFYVWSDGGIAALPGTGSDPVTNANALITLRDKNAPNDMRKSSDAGGVTCTHARNAPAPAGSIGHVGEEVRVYSCGVPMQFYDDYGSSGAMNWEVRAMVKDIFAQEDSITTPNSLAQPTRDTYFNRLDDSKMIPATGNLNFGSVEIKNNLNRQPNDVAGQYPLQIVNIGNSDILPIEVTGYDIPGVTDSAKLVRAAWFSMGSAIPCSGTGLVHNTLTNSGLAKIIHGASASSDLRICLREVQASATQQEYKTNQPSVPTAVQWEIDTTFVAA